MVILMGKGPTEAKYGLIGWKGLSYDIQHNSLDVIISHSKKIFDMMYYGITCQ